MTSRIPNTRPTDAEIIKMLYAIVNPPSRRDRGAVYRHGIRQGEALAMASALEAASAEPPPLAHITTIRELFEVIDWDFDGSGLTVTDGNLLANTIANTFPALKNDMPHRVTTADEAGSLHRPDCSPDCSDHLRMTNDGQLGDGTDGQDRDSYSDTQDRKSYTVSGVDYTFTEGC